MLSQLTEAMIINGAVLGTVLATDLGPERKIGRMRILRPLILVAVVPVFIQRPATHGTSLVVELAGVVAGVLGGLAAAALMRVYRMAIAMVLVRTAALGVRASRLPARALAAQHS
jgi:hypothetical protein